MLGQDDATPSEDTAHPSNGVDWPAGFIYATGIGVPNPSTGNVALRKAEALRAAMTDAYRRLAEVVAGVRIDATTTVRDSQLVSDRIRTEVDAFIFGAQVVREELTAEGSAEVTMRLPLAGNGGLSDILTPSPEVTVIDNWSGIRPPEQKPKPPPEDPEPPPQDPGSDDEPPEQQKPPPEPDPPSLEIPPTGIIFDCRQIEVIFSMNPRIFDETGRLVFGPELRGLRTDIWAGNMLVGFARGIDDAKSHERAVDRPWMVPVRSTSGGPAAEAVISRREAGQLRSPALEFLLQNCKVVIATALQDTARHRSIGH